MIWINVLYGYKSNMRIWVKSVNMNLTASALLTIDKNTQSIQYAGLLVQVSIWNFVYK